MLLKQTQLYYSLCLTVIVFYLLVMKVILVLCVLNRPNGQKSKIGSQIHIVPLMMGKYLWNNLWNWCLVANVPWLLVRAMGTGEGELLFLCQVLSVISFLSPSFSDPSLPYLVFFAKLFSSFLSLICLSVFLSLPLAPKGPLVCLTSLWLQDLCIQCVIIVPTLSSESLSDWLTHSLTKAHWSLCVLPGVFIYLHFMWSYPSSFSFFFLFLLPTRLFVFLTFMFALFLASPHRPPLIIFSHRCSSPPVSAFLWVPPPPLASRALIFSKRLYVIS